MGCTAQGSVVHHRPSHKGARCTPDVMCSLRLVTMVTLLCASGSQAACMDQSIEAVCICLNDVSCDKDALFKRTCPCSNGVEGTLQFIAAKLMDNNGTVTSLYLSGQEIASLQPLTGALRVVERALIIKDTSIETLEPIDSLRSIRNLIIHGNKMLSHVSGLGNLTHLSGDLAISYNSVLSIIGGISKLTQVGGNVDIRQNNRLTDISGMGSLRRVGGTLNIFSNDLLSRISGLSELSIVNGGLVLSNNRKLVSISGLGNLTRVDVLLVVSSIDLMSDFSELAKLSFVSRHVEITDNRGLQSIAGLRNLAMVGGEVRIVGNPNLSNLTGLGAGLNSTGGLILRSNHALQSLHGFEDLSFINGDLVIRENSKLSTLRGTKNSLTEVSGSVIIERNDGLHSLKGLEKLTKVGDSLVISDNDALLSLCGLGNRLNAIAGSLTVSDNDVLNSTNSLKSLTEVGGNVTIKDNARLLRLEGLKNLVRVGGDLTVVGLLTIRNLGKLQSVGRNLFISGNGHFSSHLTSGGLSSLVGVGNHVEFSSMFLSGDDHFDSLRDVGGDLIIRDSKLNARNALLHVETVGGSLDINSNLMSGMPKSFDILPNLRSLCRNSGIGKCRLQIRENEGYEHISGFRNLATFDGSLSIERNKGLASVTGFPRIVSVERSTLASRLLDESLTEKDISGAFTISFNPDLRTVEGFDSLESVAGDLLIFGNPLLDRIIMEELAGVAGLTHIAGNGENLTNITSSEVLPYFEDGCRTRKNKIPSLHPTSTSSPAFITSLEDNECNVEKLIPTAVGISIIVTIVIVSFCLFRCIFLSQRPSSASQRQITRSELRNMVGVHVLALADFLSDLGFIVTTFIVWEGQDPTEADTRLLIIGVLSASVLAGSQLFMAISVYVGLGRRMSSQGMPLLKSLRAGKAMRKRDWFLLFPGLLVLEAEVIKHLPWDPSIFVDDENANGFPHRYFARIAFAAVIMEDLPQIVLQTFFIVVIEGSDGWAITGAIASLTLSISDFIVKTVFPLLMKARPSHVIPILRSPCS